MLVEPCLGNIAGIEPEPDFLAHLCTPCDIYGVIPDISIYAKSLGLIGQKARSPFEEIPHSTCFDYRENPSLLPFTKKFYRFLDLIS